LAVLNSAVVSGFNECREESRLYPPYSLSPLTKNLFASGLPVSWENELDYLHLTHYIAAHFKCACAKGGTSRPATRGTELPLGRHLGTFPHPAATQRKCPFGFRKIWQNHFSSSNAVFCEKSKGGNRQNDSSAE